MKKDNYIMINNSSKITVMFGKVTTTRETVLKDHSIWKVENHWARPSLFLALSSQNSHDLQSGIFSYLYTP